MKLIDLKSTQLGVVERGHGRPLLLVHGFPLDHSMWRYQIEGLSDRFRVIAPDLRGFGKSSGPVDHLSLGQLADDLAELMEALDITEKITFCGLSMGGYIGWEFWKRHGSLLDSLILCDTRAAADTPAAAENRRRSAQIALAQGVGPLASVMLPKLLADSTTEHGSQIAQELYQVMVSTDPQTVAAAQHAMAERTDMNQSLSEINIHSLIICGSCDVISPAQEMREIAQAMPQAQFVEIPNAGHLAPLEQPEMVNQTIADFLIHRLRT